MEKKEQMYNFMNDLQDLLMITNNNDKDDQNRKNKGNLLSPYFNLFFV